MWCIPLVSQATKDNIPIVTTPQSPQDILRDAPVPPTDHIGSVYGIKSQPELIRYYHAAAGFPTKLTWLKAIKNGHYSTWPGLTKAAVRRSFPEAVETWKGHGQKIKMNLKSTKKLVEEETKANDSVGSLQDLEGCYHATYELSDNFAQKMYTD